VSGFIEGDRVKVVNWPESPTEPSTVNGLEGKIAKVREPFLVIDLDTPPSWMHQSSEVLFGLYCLPDELEKL
jgi:hypothetical protein